MGETGHGAGLPDHRLRRLLEPHSVALVGASPRKGSLGNEAARVLLDSGFDGTLQFVNPRHAQVEGVDCAGELQDLETPPDLAILNVGAARLEQALLDAIAAGAGSAVIFDGCFGEAADGRPLLARLRDIAREAGFPVCGGNGMGFLNVPQRCHASFVTARHLKPGAISLIAHSGSVFTVLALNDPRYRFDLVISSGQEIGATADEYVDFAVTRATTRVIALFMEAARNPEGLVKALERARQAGVPVVVCKVGRTHESAELAYSHSGAMVGNEAAYDAMYEGCGAVVVDSVDQMMNAALLLSQDRPLREGELAAVTDSGGLRELFIDRAKSCRVPLASLSRQTVATLAGLMPEGLPPSNPLDCAGAWSGEFGTVFRNGLQTLADAPEVGLLGYEADLRDDQIYMDELLALARQLPELTDKPCFFYSSFSRAHNRDLADELADLGVPVLNGLDETLSAVAAMRRLRALQAFDREADTPLPAPAPETVQRWRDRLADGMAAGEAQGLELLQDFGIATVRGISCACLQDVRAAAQELGYPLALKTASDGIAHKSDAGGVVLGLKDADDLRSAYEAMSADLGPDVLIQKMVSPGIELAFGYVRDADFGPLVMVSAGGTLIEHLDDRRCALAPFGPARAAALLDELKVSALLRGVRGAAPCDTRALADTLARFSVVCAALSAELDEMDVNPVIAGARGATAVDALIKAGGS